MLITTPSSDAALTEKLDKIETGIAEAEAKLPDLEKQLDGAKGAWANLEDLALDSPEFKEAQEARGRLGAVQDEITNLRNAQVATLKLLNKKPENRLSVADRQPSGDHSDPRGGFDPSAVLDDESLEALADLVGTTHRFGSIELSGEIVSRDEFAVAITSPDVGGMIQPDHRGMVEPVQPPLSLLNLLSWGKTTSNSVPYVATTGIIDGAVEINEGQVPPELELSFEDRDAKVKTIAGFLIAQRDTMDDADRLDSLIRSQIPNAIRRRLENQAANGDGLGPNLLGIRRQAGIQSVEATAEQNALDVMLRAVTLIYLRGHIANGHALYPVDMESIRMMRDTNGNYMFGHPSQVGPVTAWGVPMVPVIAVPSGRPLTGDFSKAEVTVRSGTSVRFADQHNGTFLERRLTALGETRLALPVHYPDAFVDGDVTPGP